MSPPCIKYFIAFLVFTLKNRLYIANFQFNLAVIATILFVDWLRRLVKVEYFRKLLGYMIFLAFCLKNQKIKSRSPASFSEKSA